MQFVQRSLDWKSTRTVSIVSYAHKVYAQCSLDAKVPYQYSGCIFSNRWLWFAQSGQTLCSRLSSDHMRLFGWSQDFLTGTYVSHVPAVTVGRCVMHWAKQFLLCHTDSLTRTSFVLWLPLNHALVYSQCVMTKNILRWEINLQRDNWPRSGSINKMMAF